MVERYIWLFSSTDSLATLDRLQVKTSVNFSKNADPSAATTERLMEEARSAGRLDLFALLEERKKHLDGQSAYVETVALLRRGRVGPAARKILVRPWIGARLVGKGAARLCKRAR